LSDHRRKIASRQFLIVIFSTSATLSADCPDNRRPFAAGTALIGGRAPLRKAITTKSDSHLQSQKNEKDLI
jgi:hypothetical protein